MAPANPFITPAYASSQRLLGAIGWVLMLVDNGQALAGTVGFVRSGRMNRTLSIPSIPVLPQTSPFWLELDAFIEAQHITRVELHTFSSAGARPPRLFGEEERVPREEFVLDLREPDLMRGCSTTHRRWIRRGAQQQLVIVRTRTRDALERHLELCDETMTRRRDRGETVRPGASQYAHFTALLEGGVGEFYQAVASNGEALSSQFILHAERGAYLASAGTSVAGRSCGASHFLTLEVAKALYLQGMTCFNLGGVREHETGLRAYKAAFGAYPVRMESVTISRPNWLTRSVTTTMRVVKEWTPRRASDS